jgi:hypothetical protein
MDNYGQKNKRKPITQQWLKNHKPPSGWQIFLVETLYAIPDMNS